jgi:hypothetical protein
MKKSVRKLTLNRETLGRLDEAQLRTAVGNDGDSSDQACDARLKQHVDNPAQSPM